MFNADTRSCALRLKRRSSMSPMMDRPPWTATSLHTLMFHLCRPLRLLRTTYAHQHRKPSKKCKFFYFNMCPHWSQELLLFCEFPNLLFSPLAACIEWILCRSLDAITYEEGGSQFIKMHYSGRGSWNEETETLLFPSDGTDPVQVLKEDAAAVKEIGRAHV